ncbi:unnamed protein product [Phytophthora fragariaefolia]|uniref:Unnamed protein product n=1 Tax=Phytophthora fragariaefolia TaxID=1490495 RepID=A0A9W6XXW8_9STRA|nr:unnamed protein product [Phytophthora fragariaefolia]
MAKMTVLTMPKTRSNRRTRKPSQHEVTTGDVPDQGQGDDVQDAEQRKDQDEDDETNKNDPISENSPAAIGNDNYRLPTNGVSTTSTSSVRPTRGIPTRDDDDDGESSDEDESSSSSDSDGDSEADDDDSRQGRRRPVTMTGDREFHRNRRRTTRDLDLPTFLPTPQTSVTTWIARVDLALEGARLSGRGDWTNEGLYAILGNKQAEEALQALDERRRQRAESDEVNAGERARVNLVQCRSTVMVETTENYYNTRVEAGDGLPTAMMLVNGATQCVKIDSGALYSVACTDWMTRDERKTMDTPVAYIEGIGGFLLDALGVWTLDMVNAYGQASDHRCLYC